MRSKDIDDRQCCIRRHIDLSRAGFLVDACTALSGPWRSLILHSYLKSIGLYCALLFVNILGLTVWIERKFFLRDTGRKLKHFDQEIHSGHSELSEEIAAQFGEE